MLLLLVRLLPRFSRLHDMLSPEKHPHAHKCYLGAAVVAYSSHIAISLGHGLDLEKTIQASVSLVELLAHVLM